MTNVLHIFSESKAISSDCFPLFQPIIKNSITARNYKVKQQIMTFKKLKQNTCSVKQLSSNAL